MRSRLHVGPAAAFDIALAAAFALVALGVFLASGRPRAALSGIHSLASRMGWRESYETGLLAGLVIVAIIGLAAVGLALLVRRRARAD